MHLRMQSCHSLAIGRTRVNAGSPPVDPAFKAEGEAAAPAALAGGDFAAVASATRPAWPSSNVSSSVQISPNPGLPLESSGASPAAVASSGLPRKIAIRGMTCATISRNRR